MGIMTGRTISMEPAVAPVPFRFSVDDYYRMAESGILCEDDRVELLDGLVVEMSPIGSRHAECVRRITDRLYETVRSRTVISVQAPIRLDDRSEPEPDIALVRKRGGGGYLDRHPQPEDVFLIVEVGDTSSERDRTLKQSLYARASVAEVWFVDLESKEVVVCRSPVDGAYTKTSVVNSGAQLTPEAFPDVRISAAEIW